MKKRQSKTLFKLVALSLAVLLLSALTVFAVPGGEDPVEAQQENAGGIALGDEPIGEPELLPDGDALEGGQIGETEIPSGGIMYEDDYVLVEYIVEEPEAAPASQGAAAHMTSDGASLSVNPPTIVYGYQASVIVTLTGYTVANGTATVYLDAGGERVAETPLVNNVARMRFDSTPAAGTYNLVAWGQDGFIAQAAIEVAENNPMIWNPGLRASSDNKTVVTFTEPISRAQSASVTVNGVSKSFSLSADGYGLIIQMAPSGILNGQKIVVKGIKYPRIFPDYSFTFTITYRTGSALTAAVTAGQELLIPVEVSGQASLSDKKLIVCYDPAVLELMDCAAQTHDASAVNGPVSGSDLFVDWIGPGYVALHLERDVPAGQAWSGVATVLKFNALATGTAGLGIVP